MALTDAQAAQLAALEAERDAPEPRTTTGLKGAVHALLDAAAGVVAHRSPEDWAELHRQAEQDGSPAEDASQDSEPAEGAAY